MRSIGCAAAVMLALLLNRYASAGPLAQTQREGGQVVDGFTFAATGDLLGYWRPKLAQHDPQFTKVVAILQATDAAFVNLEGAIFDLHTFRGYEAAENGGGYPLHDAAVATELAAIGIKLASQANNHGTDWGIEGMLASNRVLESAGIAHAGSGSSVAAARAPAMLHSPRGAVALVATASTYTPMSVAGAPGDGVAARPGISALRNQPITLVTRSEFASLREIASRQEHEIPDLDQSQVRLGNEIFRVADTPGITYDVNHDDEAEILQSIQTARRTASLVVFSIHAHETGSGDGDSPIPPDFLPQLFHRAIDSGADIIIRHGPHSLQGIEIYRGHPIFYGMGSLFFGVGGPSRHLTQPGNGTAAGRREVTMPADWYDSAIAVSEFQGGRVSQVRIYPLTMQMQPGPMFGSPARASPKDARRILEKLQRDSLQFSTRIQIEGDIGVIRPFD